MKKLLLITSMLALTLIFSVTAFAATPIDPLTEVNNSINVTTALDNSAALAETATDVKANDAKAFKGQLSTQLAELKGLQDTAKQNWASLKAMSGTIKAAMTSFKEEVRALDKTTAKAKITALKETLSPIRADIAKIHSEIKALRAQKLAARTAFKNAVQARNLTAATNHIEKIIELKKQIIEKQNLLLNLKPQVLTAIQSAAR